MNRLLAEHNVGLCLAADGPDEGRLVRLLDDARSDLIERILRMPDQKLGAEVAHGSEHEEHIMAEQPSAAQKAIGDIAPKLADLTDKVLFGDVWERPELSKRDRSLIAVTALAALYRTDQLGFHLRTAIANGLSEDELVEAMTHLAFYAGWPNAMSAITQLKSITAKSGD